MTEDQMVAIQDAIEGNDILTLHGIVGPVLELNPNDVDALFIRATYSVGDETEAEFEARVISMMNRACDLGYAPAQYQVATWLYEGVVMPRDYLRAAQLFKIASDAGYPPAMFEHGVNVYRGDFNNDQSEADGLFLIRSAAESGDIDAIAWLGE